MPIQLPETPEFDPVIVPEGGDIVRRADLVDAYQRLTNRDAYLRETNDLIRSLFIAEPSGYNTSDAVIEWSAVLDNLSNFSISGGGAILTPPGSGYYRVTLSGQATLSGGATAGAVQLISGTGNPALPGANLVGSQTMPAYPLIGDVARFNISQIVFINGETGMRVRVTSAGGSVSSIASTTRVNIERIT